MNKTAIAIAFAILAVFSSVSFVEAWGIITPPLTKPQLIYAKQFTFAIQNKIAECNGQMCDIEVQIDITEPFQQTITDIVPKNTNKDFTLDLLNVPSNENFYLKFSVTKKRGILEGSMITFSNSIEKSILLRYIPPQPTPTPTPAPANQIVSGQGIVWETPPPIVSDNEIETIPTPQPTQTETLHPIPIETIKPEQEPSLISQQEPSQYQNSIFNIGLMVIALIVFGVAGVLGYLKVYRGYFIVFALAVMLFNPINVMADDTNSFNMTLTINQLPTATFVSPTPANASSTTASFMFINISLGEQPLSCILNVNNVNYSMSLGSYFCYRNHSIAGGTSKYYGIVTDLDSGVNKTETRFIYRLTVTPPPVEPIRAAIIPLLALVMALGIILFIVSAIGGNLPIDTTQGIRENVKMYVLLLTFIIVAVIGIVVFLTS